MAPPTEIAEVVAEATYDDRALAVVADWLQQQGDPRGELIALSLAGDREAASHLQRALDPVPRCGGLLWRHGLVWRAEIEANTADQLATLLASSASWGLRELRVSGDVARVLPLLAEHASALAGLTSFAIDPSTEILPLISIESLLARMPRLARLRVLVPHHQFRTASELWELRVVAMTPEQRPAWAERPLAALERLWLHSSLELVSPSWLDHASFPQLRRLGLVGGGRCDPPAHPLALARQELVVREPRLQYAKTWHVEDVEAAARIHADAALIATNGEGVERGAVFPLVGDEVIVGRSDSPGTDLQVRSGYVARRHTRLERRDGWWLVDLGSANGTRLEHVTIRDDAMPLRDGAELEVARTTFRFVQGDIDAARRELGVA